MKDYSYLNCSVRLSKSFPEVPCLSGSGYHVYTVKPTFAVPNSCRVVKTVPIPFEYSPYLADNSFGLGLTWNLLGHEDSHEPKAGSLQTETERETDCFTLAHVKVKIKTTVTTVLRLLAFYSERKPNFRSPSSALLCFTDFTGGFCLKKDGSKEQDEEDEGMHSLAMRNTTTRGFLWLLYQVKV